MKLQPKGYFTPNLIIPLFVFLDVHVGPTFVPTIITSSCFVPNNVFFLGYSAQHMGVKCLDVPTGRVYISRDVVFDETNFPFAHLHPNAGALLRKEILLLPSHLSGIDPWGDNCDD